MRDYFFEGVVDIRGAGLHGSDGVGGEGNTGADLDLSAPGLDWLGMIEMYLAEGMGLLVDVDIEATTNESDG